MTRAIRVGPEAAAEIRDAATWYEARSGGLGLRFVEAVDAVFRHISEWPEAGSPVPGVSAGIDARRTPLVRFPYHVIYLQTPEAIRILAVAHDRRFPGYWRSRMDP